MTRDTVPRTMAADARWRLWPGRRTRHPSTGAPVSSKACVIAASPLPKHARPCRLCGHPTPQVGTAWVWIGFTIGIMPEIWECRWPTEGEAPCSRAEAQHLR